MISLLFNIFIRDPQDRLFHETTPSSFVADRHNISRTSACSCPNPHLLGNETFLSGPHTNPPLWFLHGVTAARFVVKFPCTLGHPIQLQTWLTVPHPAIRIVENGSRQLSSSSYAWRTEHLEASSISSIRSFLMCDADMAPVFSSTILHRRPRDRVLDSSNSGPPSMSCVLSFHI